jgi:hypothetical protein
MENEITKRISTDIFKVPTGIENVTRLDVTDRK